MIPSLDDTKPTNNDAPEHPSEPIHAALLAVATSAVHFMRSFYQTFLSLRHDFYDFAPDDQLDNLPVIAKEAVDALLSLSLEAIAIGPVPSSEFLRPILDEGEHGEMTLKIERPYHPLLAAICTISPQAHDFRRDIHRAVRELEAELDDQRQELGESDIEDLRAQALDVATNSELLSHMIRGYSLYVTERLERCRTIEAPEARLAATMAFEERVKTLAAENVPIDGRVDLIRKKQADHPGQPDREEDAATLAQPRKAHQARQQAQTGGYPPHLQRQPALPRPTPKEAQGRFLPLQRNDEHQQEEHHAATSVYGEQEVASSPQHAQLQPSPEDHAYSHCQATASQPPPPQQGDCRQHPREQEDLASQSQYIVGFMDMKLNLPEGIFDVDVFPTFIRLGSEEHTYEILHSSVTRLFHVPNPVGIAVRLVIQLSTSLEQGQMGWTYLVMQFLHQDYNFADAPIRLMFEDEELRQCALTLRNECNIPVYELMSHVLQALTGCQLERPGSYKSYWEQSGVNAHMHAADGTLHFLDRCLIFVAKELAVVNYCDISSVSFSWMGRTMSKPYFFNLSVTHHSGDGLIFSLIDVEEHVSIEAYLKSKDVRVINELQAEHTEGEEHTRDDALVHESGMSDMRSRPLHQSTPRKGRSRHEQGRQLPGYVIDTAADPRPDILNLSPVTTFVLQRRRTIRS